MIDYASIDGFKSIKNVAIKIKPLKTLIGLDLSGKSSVLQYFQIIKQTAAGNFSDSHMNGNLIKLGSYSGVVFNKEEQDTNKLNIAGLMKTLLNNLFRGH